MAKVGSGPRLQVIKAAEDGWSAFCRSPWTFVLFTMLVGLLSTVFQSAAPLTKALLGSGAHPAVVVASVSGGVGNTVINLWGTSGLIRGAWMGLNDMRPSFGDLARWNGPGAGRLLINQLVLAVIFGIILQLGLVLAAGLAEFNPALVAIPTVVVGVIVLYLGINQTFLPWIALLEEGNPFDTIQKGRFEVDRAWWSVLLLVVMELLLLGLGLVLCCVGLTAAAPLMVCIATAAYRQLFGSHPSTDFLKSLPQSITPAEDGEPA